jgi:soluble lytic murein transglycosylase-like protein
MTCKVRRFTYLSRQTTVLGLGLLLTASGAGAQVLSLGDDGSWTAMCTAAQNQNPSALRLSAKPLRRSAGIPAAYRSAFDAAAARYEVSTDLLEALAWQESRFNSQARSPKGAMGLMQLMPATARALGVNANDPVQNIYGGAAYLRYMLNAFDGQIDLALAAYNAGQGAVNRYGGIPPYKETRTYVSRNLDHLASLSEGGVETDLQSFSAEEVTAVTEPSHNGSKDVSYIQTCR